MTEREQLLAAAGTFVAAVARFEEIADETTNRELADAIYAFTDNLVEIKLCDLIRIIKTL